MDAALAAGEVEEIAAAVKEVGAQNFIIATDLGQQVARMCHKRVHARLRRAMAKSGRSHPNALRVWLASGTPSGVT